MKYKKKMAEEIPDDLKLQIDNILNASLSRKLDRSQNATHEKRATTSSTSAEARNSPPPDDPSSRTKVSPESSSRKSFGPKRRGKSQERCKICDRVRCIYDHQKKLPYKSSVSKDNHFCKAVSKIGSFPESCTFKRVSPRKLSPCEDFFYFHKPRTYLRRSFEKDDEQNQNPAGSQSKQSSADDWYYNFGLRVKEESLVNDEISTNNATCIVDTPLPTVPFPSTAQPADCATANSDESPTHFNDVFNRLILKVEQDEWIDQNVAVAIEKTSEIKKSFEEPVSNFDTLENLMKNDKSLQESMQIINEDSTCGGTETMTQNDKESIEILNQCIDFAPNGLFNEENSTAYACESDIPSANGSSAQKFSDVNSPAVEKTPAILHLNIQIVTEDYFEPSENLTEFHEIGPCASDNFTNLSQNSAATEKSPSICHLKNKNISENELEPTENVTENGESEPNENLLVISCASGDSAATYFVNGENEFVEPILVECFGEGVFKSLKDYEKIRKDNHINEAIKSVLEKTAPQIRFDALILDDKASEEAVSALISNAEFVELLPKQKRRRLSPLKFSPKVKKFYYINEEVEIPTHESGQKSDPVHVESRKSGSQKKKPTDMDISQCPTSTSTDKIKKFALSTKVQGITEVPVVKKRGRPKKNSRKRPTLLDNDQDPTASVKVRDTIGHPVLRKKAGRPKKRLYLFNKYRRPKIDLDHTVMNKGQRSDLVAQVQKTQNIFLSGNKRGRPKNSLNYMEYKKN